MHSMNSRIPAAGALLASLGSAASWLCCLPIAFSALGSGTSVVAATLGPVRPYLVGASIVFLAGAFFLHYRKPVACGPDGCTPTTVRRQRLILWSAAFFIVVTLTIPYWASWVIYWFALL